MSFTHTRLFLIPASLWAFLLTGCTLTTTAPEMPIASQGPAVQGKVYGGQQPVVGAQVYLYATGTTAYAGAGIAASTSNASTSLLTSAVLINSPGNSGLDTNGNYYVTTKADGSFSITGDYACTLGTGVYLYVTGGNPGAGTNSASGFLAALGACPSAGGNFASSNPGVIVNEVSTIGTAYALAGFATDATHISNSGTTLGKQGMANAFASPVELYTASSGSALATTPMGNGTVPQTTINTLGNILAACVNSTGPTSSACNTVFADTSTSTSLDMATAAIKLAQAPSVNGHVTDLFNLQTALSPFPTDLTTAPNDYTVGIKFTGGGVKVPTNIAIDGSGNVWVVNSQVNNSISKFNGSTGQPLSGAGFTGGGLNNVQSIAVDLLGNAWVSSRASAGSGVLSEFNSSGVALSGSGYTGGGMNGTLGIAIDASGNLWIANETGNSVSEFNNSGTPITGSSGYTGGGLSQPGTIAVDASGHIWIGNYGNNVNLSLSEFNSSGTPITGSSGYTGGGLTALGAIAVDGSGNIWWTDFNGSYNLCEFNNNGIPYAGSPYGGGGMSEPYAVAVDGAGNVWTTSYGSGQYAVSEFKNSGAAVSGSTGYRGGGLNIPDGIAIDGSGNVWVTNNFDKSLTELIGAATPVVTPIVANLVSPYSAPASRP